MGFVPTPEQVYDFLQDPDHSHGVIGYLDRSGHPDSALVAYSATPELGILFGTSDSSRKFRLLHADRRVAFNVTDEKARHTVQLKGIIRELGSSELTPLEPNHYGKLGEASRKYRYEPDQRFFLIEPILLRFTDCFEKPWTVTEVIRIEAEDLISR